MLRLVIHCNRAIVRITDFLYKPTKM